MPKRRGPSRIDAELIQRLIEAQPDLMLVELQQKAAAQSVRASIMHHEPCRSSKMLPHKPLIIPGCSLHTLIDFPQSSDHWIK